MNRRSSLLLAVLVGLALAAGSAQAATTLTDPTPVASAVLGTITFPSAAAAADPQTGIPSFVLKPGTTTTFAYPTSDGGQDVITIAGSRVSSTVFGWTWTWHRYSGGFPIWTWSHYSEWAGNGTCVTNRLSNIQWNDWTGPLWHYQGEGPYVVNRIDPCNTWWNAKQGHYCYAPLGWCAQDDWPWEVAESYAWGNYRAYAWGR